VGGWIELGQAAHDLHRFDSSVDAVMAFNALTIRSKAWRVSLGAFDRSDMTLAWLVRFLTGSTVIVDDRVGGSVTADEPAVFARDTDGELASESHAAHDPVLVAVVGHGVVLSGPVVPHRDIAQLPAPSDSEFRTSNPILKQPEESSGLFTAHI